MPGADMTDQPGGPPPVPEIRPAPLPTTVHLATIQGTTADGATVTLLEWRITTPAGVLVFFSDRKFSQSILQLLMAQLQQWPAELIVPQMNVAEIEQALRGNGGRH